MCSFLQLIIFFHMVGMLSHATIFPSPRTLALSASNSVTKKIWLHKAWHCKTQKTLMSQHHHHHTGRYVCLYISPWLEKIMWNLSRINHPSNHSHQADLIWLKSFMDGKVVNKCSLHQLVSPKQPPVRISLVGCNSKQLTHKAVSQDNLRNTQLALWWYGGC